ncbi:MAG: hypothetical protein IPL47_11940 [Phyllobacteriaceae bacterium]|nr:hypothetical protein [Phyllobacteriaceae bacterium]
MATVFVSRMIFLLATVLAFAGGDLVSASLFIADRAPQSDSFFGLHVAVGLMFGFAGVVLFGTQRHVAALAATATAVAPAAVREIRSLLAYLIAGGPPLCLILGFMDYTILARINEGLAVFG